IGKQREPQAERCAVKVEDRFLRRPIGLRSEDRHKEEGPAEADQDDQQDGRDDCRRERPVRLQRASCHVAPPRCPPASACGSSRSRSVWAVHAIGRGPVGSESGGTFMRYRKLGSSDLEVSEISLGSWLTYGVGVEAEKARSCLEEAFAVGINFIDTANVYGRGADETFLGQALEGRPRDSYVLATKVYFPMSDSDRGLSRSQIEKQLDASLQRLRTDYVDLYQCHRYDNETPLEETREALTRAVENGKTRYIVSSSGV